MDIKRLNIPTTTKESGEPVVADVCNLSGIKYNPSRNENVLRHKLYKYLENIDFIEKYLKDPVIMVPQEMFQLQNATQVEIMENVDYFQLVSAVLIANGGEKSDAITQLTMRQLRQKALKLRRGLMNLDKKSNSNGDNEKSSKRKKLANDGEKKRDGKHHENELTSSRTTLNAKYAERQQDMREQGQNLNGLNIDTVIPQEEQSEGPVFSIPVIKKPIPAIQKVKNEYMIHNKIHVTGRAKAQKILQMLFRVLRRADPTVNILPVKKEERTQNDNLDQEYQVPEDEEALKKWIDIARRQLHNKFIFSMRISITETPALVKRRIFDWCKGQKHFVEFKRLTTANIFFAGWLFKIHPKYHNRDDVRNWMANNNEILKQDIHLAPGKVYKTIADEKKTKIITDGLRVEVTFEKKETVLPALLSLNWENGPYNESCFVPYRVNENYTDEMQEKLVRLQQNYMKMTKQTVFRMKAPKWVIKNKLENKYTTFQQWIQNSKVNGVKIIDTLEVGNDEYVRLVYHQDHNKGVQLLMRNIQNETERTFGKEIKNKLFSVSNAPITGSFAELEEDHAQKLQQVLKNSNPQNDDNDLVEPVTSKGRRQSNQVYFAQVNETFADKVRKQQTNEMNEKNGVNNNGENLKEYKNEIMNEVHQIMDKKMVAFEQKVNANIKKVTDKQDKKIDQLQETVATNYQKSEDAAKQRYEEMQESMRSQRYFMESLSRHFNLESPDTKNTQKPPEATVKQSSREGVGQA